MLTAHCHPLLKASNPKKIIVKTPNSKVVRIKPWYQDPVQHKHIYLFRLNKGEGVPPSSVVQGGEAMQWSTKLTSGSSFQKRETEAPWSINQNCLQYLRPWVIDRNQLWSQKLFLVEVSSEFIWFNINMSRSVHAMENCRVKQMKQTKRSNRKLKGCLQA